MLGTPDLDVETLVKRLLVDEDLFLFPVHTVKRSGAKLVCTCTNSHKCERPGKHPFFNVSWKNLSSNTLEGLNKSTKNRLGSLFLSGECLDFNLAVATGTRSETTGKFLVVVDVDATTHEILELLPETFSYRTGKGGYHFWYWSDVEVKNSVSKIYEKVDIRGTGGYVIVPPSTHASGNKYALLHGPLKEIEQIPSWLSQKITSTLFQSSLDEKPKKRKTQDDVQTLGLSSWTKSPVRDIRQKINSGEKIPCGMRNITIHRLLSSDRALGTITYSDLFDRASTYANACEETQSLSKREIHGLVSSVMKYPAYNSVLENINQNYVKWMKKHHKAEINIDLLEKQDESFFNSLKKGDKLVSLEQIMTTRSEWYRSKNVKNFARYKSQFMAKKLTQLGFERKRTAKCNLWNIDFSNLFEPIIQDVSNNINLKVASCLMSCYDNESCAIDTSKLQMTKTMTTTKMTKSSKKQKKEAVAEQTPETVTEVTIPASVEESTPVEPATMETGETVASGPIGPDGFPMKLLEEREEVIKTKRKYNPDDSRYRGFPSSQEILMAETRFLADLDENQSFDFEIGALLFDENRTRLFFEFLEKEDVLGFRSEMYQVVGKETDNLLVHQKRWNKYENKHMFFSDTDDNEPEKLSVYDLDNALSIGFCQLLYRNNVPYGMDEDLEYKVKVKVYVDSVGRTYAIKSGKEIKKTEETAKETSSDQSPAQ